MSNLEMSLDDMIKMNKKRKPGRGGPPNPNHSRGREGGFRPRNSGPGPSRRFPHRIANRTTPYSHGTLQEAETKWQHDMFADHAAYPARANRVSATETGTKLLISNLDYGVSDEDIKELFSEVGEFKRYSVDFDKSGRSKGTAEVVFSRWKDAEAAVKRYNNIQLDGKPMKIEPVGAINAAYDVITQSTKGSRRYRNGAPRRFVLISLNFCVRYIRQPLTSLVDFLTSSKERMNSTNKATISIPLEIEYQTQTRESIVSS